MAPNENAYSLMACRNAKRSGVTYEYAILHSILRLLDAIGLRAAMFESIDYIRRWSGLVDYSIR